MSIWRIFQSTCGSSSGNNSTSGGKGSSSGNITDTGKGSISKISFLLAIYAFCPIILSSFSLVGLSSYFHLVIFEKE